MTDFFGDVEVTSDQEAVRRDRETGRRVTWIVLRSPWGCKMGYVGDIMRL